MKRELGIAKCGLACCLCSENENCAGCHSDGCKDKDFCENRKCSMGKGISHCFLCEKDECRTGLLQKVKPYTFTLFARKYGIEHLLDCLERNEAAGIIYHREGITGDYDDFDNVEELMTFIETGKQAASLGNSMRETAAFQVIHVSQTAEDDGAFWNITDALQSISKDNKDMVTIRIAPGVYHEKITIDRPFVTLEGSGKSNEETVLTYDDYANAVMEDGSKMGTFRSYSVFVDAHDVTLRNLTIENASGDSATHGQAIALYADGDRLLIDSCCLLGHQDTLFTGPLPPKEIVKDGFIGPKQYAPRINGRQHYKNCYICGDVDFIFGSATAYFENCTIESLRRFADGKDGVKADGACIQGYVTAASTPEGQDYGYVFYKCSIISKDCPQASVYLGRPWRNYAKTVFIDCSIGNHIHPALFHDWNKEAARETVFYGIYDRNGEEAFSNRADFVQLLTKEQADGFSKEKALAGEDKWM